MLFELPDRTLAPLENLRVGAARLGLGLLRSRELPGLAMAALEAGLGGVCLCELAIEQVPMLGEHTELFVQALGECGIELPSTQEAVECLLRHQIQSIATGAIPPYEGLFWIVNELYHPYISKTPVSKYIGDQRGLEHLIGAFYSYGDLRERPDEVSFEGLRGDAAIAALDREVQRLAQEWILREDSVA